MPKKYALRYDAGKPQWDLVHFESLLPLVRVLEFGAQKYSKHGWKKPFKDKSIIINSLLRHVLALADGEQNDPESGLPHVGHIIANAMFYSYHYGNNNTKPCPRRRKTAGRRGA